MRSCPRCAIVLLLGVAAPLVGQADWHRLGNITPTLARLEIAPSSERVLRFESFERLFASAGGGWRAVSVAEADTSLRGDVRTAFDSTHNRLLAYRSDPLNRRLPSELWSWDGHAWQIRGPVPAVFEIRGFDLLHATGRGVTIAFGIVGYPGDWQTHEWDGTGWSAVAAGGPSARTDFAAAYDATRGVLTLFGGRTRQGALSAETWEYDGVAWTQRTPATTSPPARRSAALVHRPSVGRTVLFGGADAGGAAYDLWEWDGVDWRQMPGLSLPEDLASTVQAPAAIWDPPGDRVLAQTGTALHALDATGWSEVTGPSGPEVASEGDAVFDANLGRMLFVSRDQTWSFDGARWHLESSSGVGLRNNPRLAFDTRRGRAVLFGGSWGSYWPTDTREWDGTSWSVVATPTRPRWRARQAMVFDAARAETVMFGGTQYSVTFDETWTYDGSDWTLRAPAHVPPARSEHGLAFDPVRNVVVLHGGRGVGNVKLTDTWEWDGVDWTDRTQASPPDVENGRALTWDATGARLLLFGYSPSRGRNETWTWDGAQWARVATAHTPPCELRRLPLVCDPGRGALFGLVAGEGCAPDVQAVWEFSDRNGLAEASPFGLGCAGSQGPVTLAAVAGRPIVGSPYPVVVDGLISGQPALLNVGLAGAVVGGASLPLELDMFGLPGCLMWADQQLVATLPGTGSSRQLALPLGTDPTLVGLRVELQGVALDPVANAGGAVTSNGLALTVGVR